MTTIKYFVCSRCKEAMWNHCSICNRDFVNNQKIACTNLSTRHTCIECLPNLTIIGKILTPFIYYSRAIEITKSQYNKAEDIRKIHYLKSKLKWYNYEDD